MLQIVTVMDYGTAMDFIFILLRVLKPLKTTL